jgi:hypothetical protein
VKSQDDDVPLAFFFLDTVSNLIGVMVLIAVLVAVSSEHVEVSLGTPILQAPPPDSRRVLFECRRDRVVRINDEKLKARVRNCLRDYAPRNGSTLTPTDIREALAQTDIGDEYYRVHAEPLPLPPAKDGQTVPAVDMVRWIYEPRREEQGESRRSLDEDSEYARIIAALNPQQDWAYFIVRTRDFEVFRAAREIARKRGLATGWFPQDDDGPLYFSARGHESLVQ